MLGDILRDGVVLGLMLGVKVKLGSNDGLKLGFILVDGCEDGVPDGDNDNAGEKTSTSASDRGSPLLSETITVSPSTPSFGIGIIFMSGGVPPPWVQLNVSKALFVMETVKPPSLKEQQASERP